ncbi:MAG: SigB/SigF/SigG family RNA polymerase sigma factor [Acidimicrobiia bacterium]
MRPPEQQSPAPTPDADFVEFRRTRDRTIRNRIIEHHLGLAYHLARRYRHRGIPDDDLKQVAMIGLLKSVERFDPTFGTSFASFATPTILGELRRHFRDATWAVRVPRQLQERVLAVSAAVGPLAQRLQRSPSTLEIAQEVGLSEEDVLQTLEADAAYGTTTLEPPAVSNARQDSSARLADDPEQRPDHIVEQTVLANSLVATLTEREQTVVHLRFDRNLTQTQIAERIGVSQMQISRILSGALAHMRELASESDI